MPVNTNVTVDVRNLFSVRVVNFDVKAGPPKQVDVTFEIQADKTRATMRVSVSYGKFPNEELTPGSGIKMDATQTGGGLKDFDVIKQSAWDVVLSTTSTNKVGGTGTHADVSWDDVKGWALQETTKPSISQTINTL
jgi:hypothetical protein